MKTLIIYDGLGNIFSSPISGSYIEPHGDLKYIEIEVPDGKYAKSVDVSVIPNVVVLEDMPKSEIDILKDTVDALVLTNLEG